MNYEYLVVSYRDHKEDAMAKYLLVLELTLSDEEGDQKSSYEIELNCSPQELQDKIAEKKRSIENRLRSARDSIDPDVSYSLTVTQVLPI